MGLGPLDAILGAVVVLLIWLIRRRLAWVRSTARDIGVLGTTLAVIAISYFHRWRTLRPSPDARPRFHLGGRCDMDRDPRGSAPKGRPAACPAPAFPAQTGSARPSRSRCRRGRAGDCYPRRVDHRCCRRQCDPPGHHLTEGARDPIVAPPSLLDVPHLDGWAAQWDQLVDSSPLPSPFLRSWWLTGAGGPGRHFLLVVDGARLLGGLALEKRHPMLSVRMMGDGSLCPDHLDLLAAPGHEAAVVSLLRDWLCRPGERLLDLKGIRAGSRLIEALPGRVRREPMAVAPFTPLPDSPEAYRATPALAVPQEPPCLRQAPRGRRRDASDDPRPGSPPAPRHPARTPPVPVGKPLRLPSRLRSIRGRIRWWLRGR